VDVDLSLDFLDLSPGTPDPERSACLPYAYVEDEAHRMILHRRIAEVATVKEVHALRAEIADRYGRPPPAFLRLLKLAELRVWASKKKIGRVETREGKIHLYRQRDRSPMLINGHLPVPPGTKRGSASRLSCADASNAVAKTWNGFILRGTPRRRRYPTPLFHLFLAANRLVRQTKGAYS
jgi:hypothetical protein